MIPFKKLELSQRDAVNACFYQAHVKSCENSFVNMFLWGRQKTAVRDGFLLRMSQFDRRIVYPFPVGQGNLKQALDAVIHDAAARGIPCCLAVMSEADCR